MKKFMMTFAAVLCCAMIATVFTSCSKDDDDSNTNLYRYIAEGDVYVTGGFTFGSAEYQSAINAVMGDGVYYAKDDAKVIKACDAVYDSQKAQFGDKIKGYVNVLRYKYGDDKGTVIKEYKYN